MSIAFYPGRFQPLHRGHLLCIKRILAENKKVIIGLRDVRLNPKDIFTIEERKLIIKQALKEEGIKPSQYRIVKIPDVNKDWTKQLESLFNFDIIYAGNPILKLPFKNTRYKIIHLSRKENEYSATRIRRKLKLGQDIIDLVPSEAAQLIKGLFLNKRIKNKKVYSNTEPITKKL